MIFIQFIDDYPALNIKRDEMRVVDDDTGIELIKKGIARRAIQKSDTDEARLSAKLRDTPNDETR